MFSFLASVYKPSGLTLLALLFGKILSKKICELKIPWDEILPETLKEKWDR